jgi:hypothetical protein
MAAVIVGGIMSVLLQKSRRGDVGGVFGRAGSGENRRLVRAKRYEAAALRASGQTLIIGRRRVALDAGQSGFAPAQAGAYESGN